MSTKEIAPGERLAHERNDSGTGSAPTSSENGPSEDTDAERTRSSSSGATSWTEESAGSADDTIRGAKADTSLKGLAQDMASVRLGSSPRSRTVGYADALKSNIPRPESESVSPVEDKASGPPAARHSSFGQEFPAGHPASRRTQSAETSAQVRLGA